MLRPVGNRLEGVRRGRGGVPQYVRLYQLSPEVGEDIVRCVNGGYVSEELAFLRRD